MGVPCTALPYTHKSQRPSGVVVVGGWVGVLSDLFPPVNIPPYVYTHLLF